MKNASGSKKLFQRAEEVLVGGTNSPVRSFKKVGGEHPILAAKGEGAHLVDVDGNRYLDFVMSYGPHLFGHSHPKIVEAIQKAAARSSCLGFTTEAEIEWAEKIIKRMPKADTKNYKVRAVSSGTEACSAAIRLARGVTGKNIIVKCSGHYHGHVDSLLVDAGSGVATLSTEAVPDSKGLPKALTELSRVIEFNRIETLEKVFDEAASDIAGVILEPVMGNMGVVPPDPAFLKRLRELCTQHGSLLIADEVMTGLRVDRYSAQGRFEIEPDLTCLGKVVGGGAPLAAVVGPAKIMDQLAPLGPVYQAGTLSGNPISMASGIAMLDLIDSEDPYSQLEELGQKMEQDLKEAASQTSVNIQVNRVGSMISVFFRKDPVRTAADCRDVNQEQFKRYFWALIEEGLMIPPSPFEAYFISTAHKDIKSPDFIAKMKRVFEKTASASG